MSTFDRGTRPAYYQVPTCNELQTMRERLQWSRRDTAEATGLEHATVVSAEEEAGPGGYPQVEPGVIAALLEAYTDAWGEVGDP